MSKYEIASIVIGCLNLLFVIFGSISIGLLFKQVKLDADGYDAEREENVRLNTVNVIHTWTAELKKESRLVEEFVDTCDEQTCKDIYNCKPFQVDRNKFNMILQICFIDHFNMINNEYIEDNYKIGNKYVVKDFVLSELRWHITSYLNSLEVVAISWQQGLVDRDVLFDQFSFLVANGRNTMEKYRKIAGNGDSYPAIEAFCKAIKNSRVPRHDSANPKKGLKRNS